MSIDQLFAARETALADVLTAVDTLITKLETLAQVCRALQQASEGGPRYPAPTWPETLAHTLRTARRTMTL